MSNQKFKQCRTKRFNTYEEAREAFDALDSERKRIRRRNQLNVFDLVSYVPVKKKEENE